jgi:hypothetical protein
MDAMNSARLAVILSSFRVRVMKIARRPGSASVANSPRGAPWPAGADRRKELVGGSLAMCPRKLDIGASPIQAIEAVFLRHPAMRK